MYTYVAAEKSHDIYKCTHMYMYMYVHVHINVHVGVADVQREFEKERQIIQDLAEIEKKMFPLNANAVQT